MAKKNGNWKFYIGAIVILALAAGSWIWDIAVQGESIKASAVANAETDKHVDKLEKTTIKSIAALKEEGCNPAEEANDDILVVKTEIKYIKKGIDDIKTEQNAAKETQTAIQTSQTAILEAIKTIKEK